MKNIYFIVPFIFIMLCSNAYAETISNILIDDFSSGKLDQWESKSFSGKTDYQVILQNNIMVLQSVSDSSASALYKQQKIDLMETPFLNWRWRVDSPLKKLNEQSKSGDDYAARVYVVIDGGWSFWNTKAINYVWSSNSAKEKKWPNAFANKNAMMMAIRSSTDKSTTWYQEKRNIIDDFKTLYGIDIRYIDVVALMTDTDNAGGNVTAYYDDIYFSAQ